MLAPPTELSAAFPTVLVNCYSRNSLSASIVIAFLMRERSMPYEVALANLKTESPQSDPNSDFREQLQGWEAAKFKVFERGAEGKILRRKKGFQAFVNRLPLEKANWGQRWMWARDGFCRVHLWKQ